MAVIDAHYHLETDIQPIDELIEQMDVNGISRVALIPKINNPVAMPSRLLQNVYRACLKSRTTRWAARQLSGRFDEDGNVRIPTGIVEIHRDPDNSVVMKAVRSNPERFFAWIFVNPRGRKNQIDEYSKWKTHTGVVGVKAHPFWHRFSPLELLPVAEKLEKDGRPLLLHLGFDKKCDNNITGLIRELPNLKLILAHAAFPGYKDTWKMIKENKRIKVDLSASGYVDEKTTREVVEYLGHERCIYGSDGPYWDHERKNRYNNGYIKSRIEKLFDDGRIREKILGENFRNFVEM